MPLRCLEVENHGADAAENYHGGDAVHEVEQQEFEKDCGPSLLINLAKRHHQVDLQYEYGNDKRPLTQKHACRKHIVDEDDHHCQQNEDECMHVDRKNEVHEVIAARFSEKDVEKQGEQWQQKEKQAGKPVAEKIIEEGGFFTSLRSNGVLDGSQNQKKENTDKNEHP